MPEKRLSRSTKDRVVAGVCGGLGEYFELDPVLFRLLFVIVTLIGGSGVLVYIILWLVIPEDTDTKGSTEETVSKNVKEMKKTGEKVVNRLDTDQGRLLIGVLLLLVGIFFLVDNFISIRQFFWPTMIILAGLVVIIKGIK